MLNRMKSARPNSVAPKSGQALLTLGALGVVFGDIGTSPLYSLHTACSTTKSKSPRKMCTGSSPWCCGQSP
nr:KUP/HAK/KT family potassium transporter [Corynebacterium glutamicum]